MIGRLMHLGRRRARGAAPPTCWSGSTWRDAHGPAGEDLLRRHAAAARPGDEPDRAAAGDLPGRADHRPGPGQPAGRCGTPSGSWSRRDDDPAHHAVPGGGGPAGRPDRADRRRPGRRQRHRRRAQDAGRRRAGSSCAFPAETASRSGRRCSTAPRGTDPLVLGVPSDGSADAPAPGAGRTADRGRAGGRSSSHRPTLDDVFLPCHRRPRPPIRVDPAAEGVHDRDHRRRARPPATP